MPEVDVAPVFNEYKWSFAKRRYLETCLGGIRLLHSEENEFVPKKVAATQLFLFIFPITVVAGASISLRSEEPWANGVVCGSGLLLIYSVINRTFKFMRDKTSSISDVEKLRGFTALQEEDAVDFESIGGICAFICDQSSLKTGFAFLKRCIASFLLGFVFGYCSSRSSLDMVVLSLPSFGMSVYSTVVRPPVELAQWKAGGDSNQFFFRSSHFILFCLLGMLNLTVATAVLPFLWCCGLLPSLTVLGEWFGEQVNMFCFGGTSACSSWSLLNHLMRAIMACSIIVGATAATFSQGSSAVLKIPIAVAGICAYILVSGVAFQIQDQIKCLKLRKRKTGVLPTHFQNSSKVTSSSSSKVFHRSIFKEVSTSGLVGCICFASSLIPGTLNMVQFLVVSGFLALAAGFLAMHDMFKRPFLCGMRRNKTSKSFLLPESATIIIRIVIRFCLLCLLSAATGSTLSSVIPNLLGGEQALVVVSFSVFLLRAFRGVFNRTFETSIEIFLAVCFSESQVVSSSSFSTIFWSSIPSQMFVIGFFYHRIVGFGSRMHFAWLHVNSADRSKKLRLPAKIQVPAKFLLPTGDIILSLLASFLDAPIVPIAGTTLFSIGFMRPKRLWPSIQESTGSGLEASYYAQVFPRILKEMPNLLSQGAVQASPYGETVLLLRFEKMIALLCILESELGYRVISMKGLELQEPTSCHNVEANALDSLVLETFAGKTSHEAANRPRHANCNKFVSDKAAPIAGVLEPICKIDVETYSHSSVSLTGVIENPDFLKLVDRAFLHTLVWSIEKLGESNMLPESATKGFPKVDTHDSTTTIQYPFEWQQHCKSKFSTSYLNELALQHLGEAEAGNTRIKRLKETGPEGPTGPLGDDFDIDALLDEIEDEEFLKSGFSPASSINSKLSPISIDSGIGKRTVATRGKQLEMQVSQNFSPPQQQVGTDRSSDSLSWPSKPEVPSSFPSPLDERESNLQPKDLSKIIPTEDRALSWRSTDTRRKHGEDNDEESDSLGILDELDGSMGQKTTTKNWRDGKKTSTGGKSHRQESGSRFDGFTGVSSMLAQMLRTDSEPKDEGCPESARSNKSSGSNSSSLGKSKRRFKSRTAKVESEESLSIGNQACSPLSPGFEDNFRKPQTLAWDEDMDTNASDKPDVVFDKKRRSSKDEGKQSVGHVTVEIQNDDPSKVPFTKRKVSASEREELGRFLFILVNRAGLNGQTVEGVGALHVVDCFYGKFPLTLELQWLKERKELENMVMQAFQYAFKMSLDAFLLGDPDPSLNDMNEMFECLQSYEREWFIGDSKGKGWAQAIQNEKSKLVSLTRPLSAGKTNRSYGVLQLSLQKEPVALCELKIEIVRGIWSSLSTELLYLTNDDDERYSIQAHPSLLRNLIVQAAEPPLGYPVYVSESTRV